MAMEALLKSSKEGSRNIDSQGCRYMIGTLSKLAPSNHHAPRFLIYKAIVLDDRF